MGDIKTKVDGSWKKVSDSYVKINGQWKQAVPWKKIDGSWVEFGIFPYQIIVAGAVVGLDNNVTAYDEELNEKWQTSAPQATRSTSVYPENIIVTTGLRRSVIITDLLGNELYSDDASSGTPSFNSVVVDKDFNFYVSSNSSVFKRSFDIDTQSVNSVWTDSAPSGSGDVTALSSQGDYIYIGYTSGRVRKVEKDTGNESYRTNLSSSEEIDNLAADINGEVYIRQNRYFAKLSDSGSILFENDLGSFITRGDVAVTPDYIVASGRDRLYKFDRSGNEIITESLDTDDLLSSRIDPAVDGVLYTITKDVGDRRLRAFDEDFNLIYATDESIRLNDVKQTNGEYGEFPNSW